MTESTHIPRHTCFASTTEFVKRMFFAKTISLQSLLRVQEKRSKVHSVPLCWTPLKILPRTLLNTSQNFTQDLSKLCWTHLKNILKTLPQRKFFQNFGIFTLNCHCHCMSAAAAPKLQNFSDFQSVHAILSQLSLRIASSIIEYHCNQKQLRQQTSWFQDWSHEFLAQTGPMNFLPNFWELKEKFLPSA